SVADEVYVLTEVRQRELIEGVVPEVDDAHVILEPSARGTAKAYGLAALTLLERSPDAVMIALPADHVVRGTAAAARAVKTAVDAATRTRRRGTRGLHPAL